MTSQQSIKILYFSDVLCVWAYIAQRRMDQLNSTFAADINLQDYFFPVFGSARHKISQGWETRGGFKGYGQHVLKIAAEFDHIKVHPDIWQTNIPHSSSSCHVFIKSVQLLQHKGMLKQVAVDNDETNLFEKTVWAFRQAFFRDLRNIAELKVQLEIAEQLNLPINKILEQLHSGEAYAALDRDLQLKEQYRIEGSPTLVFNEGRQKIYGNVGYKVIEANIQEIISHSSNQASWC